MKHFLWIIFMLVLCMGIVTATAQTVTLTTSTETSCGIMQYSPTNGGSIGCTGELPVASSNGASGVSIHYGPIYNASSIWPGLNVIEFFGLFPQYSVGHVTAFTRIDAGTKDDEGYELWQDSLTFVSEVIYSPYGNSYAGSFSGSCAALVHITPIQGAGRYGGHKNWDMERLNCTINQ